jgi:hypothetical protein
MEKVFIVHFKEHTSYIRKVVFVGSNEKKAIEFCKSFAEENPEYKLRRKDKNSKIWISEGFNHGLEIEPFAIDIN